jgi:aspartyl-tRNA(Asn)/glutamyl-tRNA(Gln) amidotransferase subunit C
MKVDKNTIQYIAKLAKLKFTENEAAEFAGEFEKILGHFENIDKENLTDSDLKLISDADAKTVLRGDEIRSFDNQKELFRNAKQMRDGFLVIPKVLE